MDGFCRAQRKVEKIMTDQEKLEQAIKKAKADRARKAVNNSLNRSIASIKRRKQQKQSALQQMHALKQASVLQQKNSQILSALKKAKDYNRQLENANFYLAEQQKILSHQLALKQDKIQTLKETENNMLRKKIADADMKLKMIQNSFSNALLATNVIEEDLMGDKAEKTVVDFEELNQTTDPEMSMTSTGSESQSSIDSSYDSVTEPVTNHDMVSMDLTDTAPGTLDIEKNSDVENVPPSEHTLETNNCKVESDKSENSKMEESENDICNEPLGEGPLDWTNPSPHLNRRSSSQRHSITKTDDENEKTTRRRSSRSATAVSYAEPSLHSKLRRGDRIADGSLYCSLTPKKTEKKRRGKVCFQNCDNE